MHPRRCVKHVIRFARQRDRSFSIKDLRARLHMRDDLHVDTSGIHLLEADLAKIVELARWSMRRDASRPAVAVPQLRNPKVLLDRDDSLLGRHYAPLSC